MFESTSVTSLCGVPPSTGAVWTSIGKSEYINLGLPNACSAAHPL
jgi:hypothetical protein